MTGSNPVFATNINKSLIKNKGDTNMEIILNPTLNDYIKKNYSYTTKVIIGLTGIFLKGIDNKGNDRFESISYDFIKNKL